MKPTLFTLAMFVLAGCYTQLLTTEAEDFVGEEPGPIIIFLPPPPSPVVIIDYPQPPPSTSSSDQSVRDFGARRSGKDQMPTGGGRGSSRR